MSNISDILEPEDIHPPTYLMTKAGTFTARAIEELIVTVKDLQAEVVTLKREKSILMRELSRFTNKA